MVQVTINDITEFSLIDKDGQWYIDGEQADWDASWQANGLISILHNGRSYTAIIEEIDAKNKEISVMVNGQVYKASIKEPIDLLLKNMGLDAKAMQKAEPVKAPMPGMVLKVLVAPGQKVEKGDGLVILEAMKMENILKAASAATVKSVRVAERTAVEKGAVLIEME